MKRWKGVRAAEVVLLYFVLFCHGPYRADEGQSRQQDPISKSHRKRVANNQ